MRFIRFVEKLEAIRRGMGVDLVAHEKVSVGTGARANFQSAIFQGKLTGVLEEWVERRDGVEGVGVHFQTIKMHAIPRQGAKRNKEEMVAAAHRRWPDVEFEDDNQADAMWILDWAIKEYGRGIND
jgi:hypothetical protein